MNIIWHGQSLFEIITTPQKNNQLKIVIDPFSENIGLRLPKLEADILLTTHLNRELINIDTVKGEPFLISNPGEYELKEVFIQGIPSWSNTKEGKEDNSNTIYTIESEDIKLCHLGIMGQKELTTDQMEKIGEVDILMIPVGGLHTISAKEAVNIMSQIEPKVIIPMYYSLSKLKIKLDSLDSFLKTLGLKNIQPMPKLTIKKKDISGDEAKIIVLEP